MKKEWWKKPRTCLKCGHKMEPGMLPGYFNCRGCGFFIDIQVFNGGSIIAYILPKESMKGLMMPSGFACVVPEGCMAVFSWESE